MLFRLLFCLLLSLLLAGPVVGQEANPPRASVSGETVPAAAELGPVETQTAAPKTGTTETGPEAAPVEDGTADGVLAEADNEKAGQYWGRFAWPVAATFGIALLASLLLVPPAKRLARRAQLVDHPDQKRKLHKEPIPLIGGIVVFCSALIATTIALLTFRLDPTLFSAGTWQLLGLFLASLLILLIGIIDDRYGMRGRQKLLGQFLAATVLIAFGYRFELVGLFGKQLDLQVFSLIVVYGWILVGINSVNLLDGADGFASTIGLLMTAALCVMAVHLGKGADALLLAAACGAVLGFLRFNFPPATAYLGDAGSMLIGLFVSAMSIRCASKQATFYALMAPIALLAIPLFDTVAAIVRRRLTGRSIYTVDRGHLHHALIRKGYGPRKALLMFFAMCLMTALGGTLSLIYQESEYALISIGAVVVFLFVGKVFGVAEFQLIANRSAGLARSFLIIPKRNRAEGDTATQVLMRLQGDKNWDSCWQVLRDFAREKDLIRLTMDLNLPWLHESFHAKYQQLDKKNIKLDEVWSAGVPLIVDDRSIGRLDFSGQFRKSDYFTVSKELDQVLKALMPVFRETIAVASPIREDDAHFDRIREAEFGPAFVKNADLKSGPIDQVDAH